MYCLRSASPSQYQSKDPLKSVMEWGWKMRHCVISKTHQRVARSQQIVPSSSCFSPPTPPWENYSEVESFLPFFTGRRKLKKYKWKWKITLDLMPFIALPLSLGISGRGWLHFCTPSWEDATLGCHCLLAKRAERVPVIMDRSRLARVWAVGRRGDKHFPFHLAWKWERKLVPDDFKEQIGNTTQLICKGFWELFIRLLIILWDGTAHIPFSLTVCPDDLIRIGNVDSEDIQGSHGIWTHFHPEKKCICGGNWPGVDNCSISQEDHRIIEL